MAYEKYAVIEWHDEPGRQVNVIVSVDKPWNSIDEDNYDDSRIFYYFANEKEYEDAKNKDNTDYEFWIVEGE